MKKSSTRRALVWSCVGSAGLVALCGCASQPEAEAGADERAPRAVRAVAPWFSGDRPVSQTLAMTNAGASEKTRLIGRQKMSEGWTPEPGMGTVPGGVGETMLVSYAANEASAEEVIRVLVGDFLGRSFVIDPSIMNAKQQVTMVIDEEMTRADLRDLLGGLASVYGWMLEERGEVLYFRSKGSGNSSSGSMARSDTAPIITAEAAFESDAPVVRVKRLRHMSAADATNAVKDLMSQGATAVASGRTVLLVDTVRQANRVSRILDALDVPAFEGVEIHTYRLAHRANADAVQLLTNIASQTTGAPGAGGNTGTAMSFVAVAGTNDIMVIARDQSLLTMARDLIETIDRPAGDGSAGAFLYRIQHYEPSELVRMVRDFFGDEIEVASGTGSGRQNQNAGGGDRIRLVLDAEEDLLLVRATPERYADLLTLVRAIDRPRQQVMLNAVIAEVVLENRLEFGVDYFLNAYDQEGTVLDLFATPGLVANPSGSLTLLGADGQLVIQALRSESDVDVLSQPRLVVRDRFAASFQVGGQVPVVRGDLNSDTTVDGSTAIRRDIEYEDTGVTLEITPKINESGSVTLEIRQEINEVGGQSELGPEFTTRVLQTEVTVPHGKTILLAGIIENSIRKNTRKTPILGELPVVGVAFQDIEDVEEKRELLLAITPTIVSDPMQAQGTLGDFFAATRAIRAALDANADSLSEGLLNSAELERALGGYGEESETPGAAPLEESEGGADETEFELLIEPASHAGEKGGEPAPFSFGFWTFGASGAEGSEE